MNEFLTQTQIGLLYKGSKRPTATSHEVGIWLEELGFRENGKPTELARALGLVTRRASRGNNDFPVFVWHIGITKWLDEHHERIDP